MTLSIRENVDADTLLSKSLPPKNLPPKNLRRQSPGFFIIESDGG